MRRTIDDNCTIEVGFPILTVATNEKILYPLESKEELLLGVLFSLTKNTSIGKVYTLPQYFTYKSASLEEYRPLLTEKSNIPSRDIPSPSKFPIRNKCLAFAPNDQLIVGYEDFFGGCAIYSLQGEITLLTKVVRNPTPELILPLSAEHILTFNYEKNFLYSIWQTKEDKLRLHKLVPCEEIVYHQEKCFLTSSYAEGNLYLHNIERDYSLCLSAEGYKYITNITALPDGKILHSTVMPCGLILRDIEGYPLCTQILDEGVIKQILVIKNRIVCLSESAAQEAKVLIYDLDTLTFLTKFATGDMNSFKMIGSISEKYLVGQIFSSPVEKEKDSSPVEKEKENLLIISDIVSLSSSIIPLELGSFVWCIINNSIVTTTRNKIIIYS